MTTNHYSRHTNWQKATFFGLIFLFLALAIKLKSSFITDFDTTFQALLKPFTSPTTTTLVAWLTKLASAPMELFYAFIVIIWLYHQGKKSSAYWAGLTVLVANAITYLIKYTIQRPRPSDKLVFASGYSFPSGHTFGATLLALLIVHFVLPKIKSNVKRRLDFILACLWVLLVALSRIYLHVHYPSDTLASVFLALTIWPIALNWEKK